MELGFGSSRQKLFTRLALLLDYKSAVSHSLDVTWKRSSIATAAECSRWKSEKNHFDSQTMAMKSKRENYASHPSLLIYLNFSLCPAFHHISFHKHKLDSESWIEQSSNEFMSYAKKKSFSLGVHKNAARFNRTGVKKLQNLFSAVNETLELHILNEIWFLGWNLRPIQFNLKRDKRMHWKCTLWALWVHFFCIGFVVRLYSSCSL